MHTSRTVRLAFFASVICAIAAPASAQQPQPNIPFILADNVGYGDIGAYGGGELRGSPTPRIDQLAAEGLRLTQFLVEPGCTPSRAALMTGRYSIRSGLSLVAVEGTDISLPAREITMAEMLRDAGYATAIFGKWHLGDQPKIFNIESDPREEYNIGAMYEWVIGPVLKAVDEYNIPTRRPRT
jgi:arylsulfatase